MKIVGGKSFSVPIASAEPATRRDRADGCRRQPSIVGHQPLLYHYLKRSESSVANCQSVDDTKLRGPGSKSVMTGANINSSLLTPYAQIGLCASVGGTREATLHSSAPSSSRHEEWRKSDRMHAQN